MQQNNLTKIYFVNLKVHLVCLSFIERCCISSMVFWIDISNIAVNWPFAFHQIETKRKGRGNVYFFKIIFLNQMIRFKLSLFKKYKLPAEQIGSK